jgi:hypothetical protein
MPSNKSLSAEHLKLINNLEDAIDEGKEGTHSTGVITPEPFMLTQLIGALRDGEKSFGQTPNTDITKDRLLAKQEQNISNRGELEQAMLGGQQEVHPILASAYFSGIDQAVNPSTEFMTEEEVQRYAEQLQYQQRLKLEKRLQNQMSSAPILTR